MTPPALLHLQGLFQAIGESIDDAGFFVNDENALPLYVNTFAVACLPTPKTIRIDPITHRCEQLQPDGNAINEWIDKSRQPTAWREWDHLMNDTNNNPLRTEHHTQRGTTVTFFSGTRLVDPSSGLRFALHIFHMAGFGSALDHPELLQAEDPRMSKLGNEVRSCLCTDEPPQSVGMASTCPCPPHANN
eukprot:TRINITY_DN654_c1_g2_i5.p2 TRINITY_DN654_c1_g2~~TRINITY_DN654_c1_g2_i5.p2  ORF type:complete len:189 (+),score=50.86 TRINITY_DN654_c1_g2_i5:248-814(+)